MIFRALLVSVFAATINNGCAQVSPHEIFQKSRAAYAVLTSYRDDGTYVTHFHGIVMSATFSTKLMRPSFYRIDSTLGSGVCIWSAGDDDFMQYRNSLPVDEETTFAKYGLKDKFKLKKVSQNSIFSSADVLTPIPGIFFNSLSRNPIQSTTNSERRLADEDIDSVPCFVISIPWGIEASLTIWIGQSDFLIRKTKLTKYATKPANFDFVAIATSENIQLNPKFVPADFLK